MKPTAEMREINRGLGEIAMLMAGAKRAGLEPNPMWLEQKQQLRWRLENLRRERRAKKKALRKLRHEGRSQKPIATPRIQVTRSIQYQYDPADDDRLSAFYASREWKMMRYEALRKHGGRCQCCGASPQEGKRLNVDHIFAARVYWDLRLDLNNLQVLCEDCNEGKGARHADDWRPVASDPS